MSRRGNCCDNAAIESCWGSGFSLRRHHPVRHRSHAYDQEGADENRGWNPSVRRRAVLFDGYVSSPYHFGYAHQDGLIATEPKWAPFQVGANLEPLSEPLQIVIRLLRVLIPASSTPPLPVCLP